MNTFVKNQIKRTVEQSNITIKEVYNAVASFNPNGEITFENIRIDEGRVLFKMIGYDCDHYLSAELVEDRILLCDDYSDMRVKCDTIETLRAHLREIMDDDYALLEQM